jgi:uncharacterized protein YjbI with pentapeptide repeats
MILGKDHAEFTYHVKPNGVCDTRKYRYRGQFLEIKKFDNKDEEDEKISKEPISIEDIQKLCDECSSNYENCSSGLYFRESDIDADYTESRSESATYYPTHILVQCPNVLKSFISNHRKNGLSLAKFLRKNYLKSVFPENHVVHPVYRQHTPGRVPDLKESDLTGSDFSYADFTNSSLENCHFANFVMLFATLEGAKLSGSIFCDTLISHSNLREAEADQCKLTKTRLVWSDVEGACLDKVIPSIGGNCLDGTNISDEKRGELNRIPTAGNYNIIWIFLNCDALFQFL